ncbi:hypothetical protein ACMU_16275 [Actibacterium mucosum KCTC 23349]|uniref:Uncharacterized protein n=2 Tax=Actibacterium TaxID=1433986 RepID=A0A037ZGK1_9RHOB|nr:hypothetical protein ACMU_16275 [Actibacterium mucosum KCTC 23349]
MQVNAASCLGFGALFAVAPGVVAQALGTPPVWLILALGVGLIGNGLHLILASRRAKLRPDEVIWFSIGDLAWFLGSMGLLAAQLWVTTPLGVGLTWAVALGVVTLGLTQLWMLGQGAAGVSSGIYLRQILRTWLSMKLWVKIWLFFLNGVFLWAFTLVPSDFARVTLIGYVACGPVLLAFAFRMGGLSRAAGWGHLIPWVPMVAWWLIDGIDTPYKALLLASTLICLAFDLFDVARYHKGDRALIGALA